MTLGGAVAYRATTARWHADRRAARPEVVKLAVNGELRRYVHERLAGTIAAALPDGAQASGASLLVMGAFGHSRLRLFVLGSPTSDLMKTIRMPVLVSH